MKNYLKEQTEFAKSIAGVAANVILVGFFVLFAPLVIALFPNVRKLIHEMNVEFHVTLIVIWDAMLYTLLFWWSII